MFLIYVKVKVSKYALFKGRGVIEDDELVQRNPEKYLSNKWKTHCGVFVIVRKNHKE